ncbi:MAG TPA: ABC transporter permease, partial [Kofleriaceae bacterium]|nr:ABC transporter permease [Kofleriaceae bacterium]
MRSPGFQWFVAWRYLMARPRRLSGVIVLFATAFAWAGGAVAYGRFMSPLTDEYIAAGQPLPGWLPMTYGVALSLSAVLFLAAATRAVRRMIWPRRASFGAAASPSREPLFIALGGMAALAQLAIASALAGDETSFANLPGLGDQPSAWMSWPVLLALAVLFGAVVAGVALRRPSARATAVRVAMLAAAMIPVALAHVHWWRIVEYGMTELGGQGMAIDYYPPVWLTIVGGLAGALFTLSLILLGIRYFFTFFTTVSMGGVAIGTMALVITLSVMSGFETDLRGKILGSNAHMLITRNDEAPFPGYRDVMEKAASVRGVVAQTPYLTSEVVIAGSSNYFNVVIKGIDPRTIASVTDLGKDLDDEEALERMWPLSDDGAVVGPPAVPPAGPDARPPSGADVTDPAPPDLSVGEAPPIDFSGTPGAEAPQPTQPPVEPSAPDPAPADLEVG